MSQVVHKFVDNDGRTHVDEFDLGGLTLDMDTPPDEYHLFLGLRSNARFIADMHKECDDGTRRRRVMIACPSKGMDACKSWDAVKIMVREMCWDNPAPTLGGFRPSRAIDYVNMRTVDMQTNIHKSLNDKIEKARADGVLTANTKPDTAQRIIKEMVLHSHEQVASPKVILSTLSGHALWQRLAWITDLHHLTVFNLIGECVDPTWYIDPDNPRRTGSFKERCGIYCPQEASVGPHVYTGLWTLLSKAFEQIIDVYGAGKVDPDLATVPGMFFSRYGLKWLIYYVDHGMDEREAIFWACWRYMTKMANYIWLNWMEVTHITPPQGLDEEKFFLGDKAAADASFNAACGG